ncbi:MULTISPECIES: nitroreductase/quinone reductase family protein [unclassified Nonomuraea]|uniref:nitroreductase/quinone reductase family protein n=1 Tax=unclassified Nonomuraea TaxID=2593643 RepID=UPI0025A419B2|nr:nitroreductase/quinone reductase family protein [Nonomuraea sp. KC401]
MGRKTLVMRVEHKGHYAAVAIKAGMATNPHWYASVLADPVIELQDGAVTRQFKAREVSGSEKQLWWRRARLSGHGCRPLSPDRCVRDYPAAYIVAIRAPRSAP